MNGRKTSRERKDADGNENPERKDDSLEIRLADNNNFDRNSMNGFLRFQEVNKVYRLQDGERVVGEIMLLPELHKGRLVIDSLHVSGDFRRHGIGKALIEKAAQEALERGAHALYASCCSAKETIDFYIAMGFLLSADPISSCVADEPFDIQMECPL